VPRQATLARSAAKVDVVLRRAGLGSSRFPRHLTSASHRVPGDPAEAATSFCFQCAWFGRSSAFGPMGARRQHPSGDLRDSAVEDPLYNVTCLHRLFGDAWPPSRRRHGGLNTLRHSRVF